METSVSTETGTHSKIGWVHPNSLKNLRPAWGKGQSGHPGRAPKPLGAFDQSNDAWKHTLDAALSGSLKKSRANNRREKIVLGWIDAAIHGSWPHLDAILKRKLPLPVEGGGGSRVILQGIRLELDEDGKAKGLEIATQVRELNGGQGGDGGVCGQGGEAGETFAVSGEQESYGGARTLEISSPPMGISTSTHSSESPLLEDSSSPDSPPFGGVRGGSSGEAEPSPEPPP